MAIPVVLENSSDAPISGTLRVKVIDRWSVEPNHAIPFTLAPKGRVRHEFTVQFSRGTYNADYPIHAYAQFDWGGKSLTAHPVLVVRVRQPDAPRAKVDFTSANIVIPETGQLAIWRLPQRRDSVRVEPIISNIPARESFESLAVVEVGNFGPGSDKRTSLSMTLGPRRPSLREKVTEIGSAYSLQLPANRKVRISFGIAADQKIRSASLRVDAVSGSASPRPLIKELATEIKWKPEEVDLSAFAGLAVKIELQCEGEGGTVYWSEPTVIVDSEAGPTLLPTRQLPGMAGGYVVEIRPGSRGILNGTIQLTKEAKSLGINGFDIKVLGESLRDERCIYALRWVGDESAGGYSRFRHRFDGWAGSFDLLSELWVADEVLRSRFWLENTPSPQPWLHAHIEELSVASWSTGVSKVFLGIGNVLVRPKAFELPFDGHRLAASFAGLEFDNGVAVVQAVDVPPNKISVSPRERRYSLNSSLDQTMTFIPSSSAWDGARRWREINQLRAGPGVPKLAGRFVFDLWMQSPNVYEKTAAELQKAFRYGLTDSMVVWHNWQRWGYDYRLPDVFPPNPLGGSLGQFRSLVELCKANGVLFAPHDNYIDLYPDADDFSFRNVVFNPDGRPQGAWFNFERQAQSYRARPDRVQALVERNLHQIREGIGPSAYFIDVWSSKSPHDFWTEDGVFLDRRVTKTAWAAAFDWIRDFLGGAPQVSESGHDQLIGHLDGAQTQHLRVDAKGKGFVLPIDAEDAERIPWYDFAHHDRFVLHGAGYQGRYPAGLDPERHGIFSDDYMATEVLTGHPAMVNAPFGRDVVRKYWLLHDAMKSLGQRRIESVEFSDGDIHRQLVRWDNGGSVWVNRGSTDWSVDGRTLPPFGFLVRIPTPGGAVEAAIERRGGGIVEWSRSPSSTYVNARDGKADVLLGDSSYTTTTDGGFRITQENATTLITPLPNSKAFRTEIQVHSLTGKSGKPRWVESLDESGVVRSRARLDSNGQSAKILIGPDVFQYRLVN
ncbi:MAG: hypothetical protein SFV18_16130 [Bryobacteraceae bacterium]|nr:hypothetical protein [Bryobacteraceae bacterium]